MKRKRNGKLILILGIAGLFIVIGAVIFGYLSYTRPPKGATPQEIAALDIERININTASAEELEALPMLSKKQAQSIIDYRTENGGFDSPEELIKVKGISKTTFEQLALYITAE